LFQREREIIIVMKENSETQGLAELHSILYGFSFRSESSDICLPHSIHCHIGCFLFASREERRRSQRLKVTDSIPLEISLPEIVLFMIQANADDVLYLFPVDRVQGRSPRYDSWKMPTLVNGPLGIVSWIELAFLAMFSALLVWSFSSYLHAMFANVAQEAIQERERV